MKTPYIAARRWLFFGLVGATTLLGSLMMFDIVRAGGVTSLEIGIIGLFVPTFGWISLTLWNAVVGFALQIANLDPISLRRSGIPARTDAPISSRTALVMPACNEDTERLMDGLASVIHSLEDTGHAEYFDIHLLSDTTDTELALIEEGAFKDLRERVPRPGRLHYRRRARNIAHKAGNIADFCEKSGSGYDFMVVLDADSIMSGPTLITLVREMEANPRAGLIQTVPIPFGQNTVFGRIIQFSGALYGPMFATGQAFWMADTANYWGHNAILRVQPFVDHAHLPILSGKPPLGGRILSHDFVEAALLRRAGWFTYLMPDLGGSYEEVPTNVLDYAKRDRRWAQGSLQHLKLLRLPNLNWLSRLHFLTGAMGYLASLLWLLILVASTAYVLLSALSPAELNLEQVDLPTEWYLGNINSVLPLLSLTALVLFLPNGLGLGLALIKKRGRFGGALPLAASTILQSIFSILIAPLLMIYHTRFVLSILAGRDVDWGAQSRAGRIIGWREASSRAAGVTAIGLAWAAAIAVLAPAFVFWMTPVFAGLLLAIPIVKYSSSTDLGHSLRRRSILLTPSETRLPPELRPYPQAKRKTARMHEAGRGLFDLQRGLPLLVTPPEAYHEKPSLSIAVEALDPERLSELKKLGSGPLRLIVTKHRAETMGVDASWSSSGADPVGIELNGETAAELFGLSSAVRGFDATGLDAHPATQAESAALELVRFGRLLPAVVTVSADLQLPELVSALDDGEILKVTADHVREMAAAPGASITVMRVSDAHVPLEGAENARFMLFREANGLFEHVAVLIGDQESWPEPVPVRLHSACLTGDLIGSLKCDCGAKLRGSIESFASGGGGVLLYLQQEGRGIGLGNKLRAYALQQQDGLDTVDADHVLGFRDDERQYDAAVGMLKHLGIERVRILTNNPDKVKALEEGGIRVLGREPLHGKLNRYNLPYVRAKVQRAGHWLGDMLHGARPGA